jgi:hypothetical protein
MRSSSRHFHDVISATHSLDAASKIYAGSTMALTDGVRAFSSNVAAQKLTELITREVTKEQRSGNANFPEQLSDLKQAMEDQWKIDYGTSNTTLTNVTDDGTKIEVTFNYLYSVTGSVPLDDDDPLKKAKDHERKMPTFDDDDDVKFDDEPDPTETEDDGKLEGNNVDDEDGGGPELTGREGDGNRGPELKPEDEDKLDSDNDDPKMHTVDEEDKFKEEDEKDLDQEKLKKVEENYFDKDHDDSYLDEQLRKNKPKLGDKEPGSDDYEKFMNSPFAVDVTKGGKTLCYHCTSEDGELRILYVEFYDGKRVDTNSFHRLPKPIMREFERVAREDFKIDDSLADFITIYNAFRKRRRYLAFLREAREILMA